MPDRKMKSRLTEGSVGKTLYKLTVPMLFAMIGMVIFNLADTFFIGQLGTVPLAAITFTFPVILIINSLAQGLGVGVSALVSRAIGERDRLKVQYLTTTSLLLAVMIVLFFVIVGLLSVDPLFRLLGAGDDTLPLIKEYMQIWYIGSVFVVIPMVGNNAIRATGDTKTPSAVMSVAAVINVILDPLLIFGLGPFPELGIKGAAIATVAARMTTFCVALYVLHFRENMLKLFGLSPKLMINYWKRILYIGLPSAGTRIILPIGTGIITRLISQYGNDAVAGFGVATRLEFFALALLMALSSVLGPFAGQNLGAKKTDRVKSGINMSNRFSVLYGIGIWIVLALVAKPVAAMFNDTPSVVMITSLYLLIVPVSYGLVGVTMQSGMSLNVLNQPMKSAGITAVQMFVLYIPIAYLASSYLGVGGIFGALAFANILTGLLARYTVNRELRLLINVD